MNVVLLVVDSLRGCWRGFPGTKPRTPFLDELGTRTIHFVQARGTECWTLPSHLSVFTGLLPSEHGAHFQHLGYDRATPTAAERFRAAGFHTEVITRNSLFDGSVPGATRGFEALTIPLANIRRLDPLGLLLALSKPRVKRLIRESGFFHASQRESRRFLLRLSRMIVPADRLALEHALHRMRTFQSRRRPYFLFVNLYDVHAPYPPRETSPLRSFSSLGGALENLMLPRLATQLGQHRYLCDGFAFSPRAGEILRERYRDAVELMDRKLAEFYGEAERDGLLDDTVLILTSDHGEAFGDHGLFFHDGSVYDTHLRVPLWIHFPGRSPRRVTETISSVEIHELLVTLASGGSQNATIVGDDRAPRAALAEHFFYPHVRGISPQYAYDQAAATVNDLKLAVRRTGTLLYDLGKDPSEEVPMPCGIGEFAALCKERGAEVSTVRAALGHLARWQQRLGE